MDRRTSGPPWWQAAALVALMVVLLWLAQALPLSARGHQLTQGGVVLLVYALLGCWLARHREALREESRQRYRESVKRAYDERWATPPLNARQQHFREVVQRATPQEKLK